MLRNQVLFGIELRFDPTITNKTIGQHNRSQTTMELPLQLTTTTTTQNSSILLFFLCFLLARLSRNPEQRGYRVFKIKKS